jgi:hypothetical protein
MVEMTPEQIAEAERQVAGWEPKECDAEEVAAPSDRPTSGPGTAKVKEAKAVEICCFGWAVGVAFGSFFAVQASTESRPLSRQ